MHSGKHQNTNRRCVQLARWEKIGEQKATSCQLIMHDLKEPRKNRTQPMKRILRFTGKQSYWFVYCFFLGFACNIPFDQKGHTSFIKRAGTLAEQAGEARSKRRRVIFESRSLREFCVMHASAPERGKCGFNH